MKARNIGMAGALAMIAPFACAQVMAQSVTNVGFQVTPERAEGVQLRRVAAPTDGRLVYEYQNGAGVAHVAIDPTTLVSDIERARKRAQKKSSAKKAAPVAAQPAAVQPEIAQAELETAVAVSPEPQERKVRVIQLYNVPKAD